MHIEDTAACKPKHVAKLINRYHGCLCGCLSQARDLFTKQEVVLADELCVSVNATGIALFKLEVLGRAVSVS